MAAVRRRRGTRAVCPASSTQPAARPPVTASSGSHHQMARSTGHAATRAAMRHAGTRPISPPVIRDEYPCAGRAELRLPLADQHGGGQQGDSGPDDEEDDLRLADVGPHDRLLDDGHGSRAAPERQAAIRLGHDATSFLTGVRCGVTAPDRAGRNATPPGPGSRRGLVGADGHRAGLAGAAPLHRPVAGQLSGVDGDRQRRCDDLGERLGIAGLAVTGTAALRRGRRQGRELASPARLFPRAGSRSGTAYTSPAPQPALRDDVGEVRHGPASFLPVDAPQHGVSLPGAAAVRQHRPGTAQAAGQRD